MIDLNNNISIYQCHVCQTNVKTTEEQDIKRKEKEIMKHAKIHIKQGRYIEDDYLNHFSEIKGAERR